MAFNGLKRPLPRPISAASRPIARHFRPKDVQIVLAVARAAAQDHDVAAAVHAGVLVHPEHRIGHGVPLVQHVDQLLLPLPGQQIGPCSRAYRP